MIPLAIEVLDARTEPHAAVPTIMARLQTSVPEAVVVDALALRCQIRIEPQRRRYSAGERDRLYDRFGDAPQWGDSLRPFLWTHTSTVVPRFTGSTVVDLPLVCTYDFEVAGASYLHSLEDGEIPLNLLFAGTMFTSSPRGLSVVPIPWDLEASHRMPVALWRDTMDAYFPNSAWVRVGRDTLDGLRSFRASRGFPTWDQAIEQLCKEAEVPAP